MRTTVAIGLIVCVMAMPAAAPGRSPFKNYWDEAKIEREVRDEKRFPQYKKWIDIAKKTPTVYSGTVRLDGKPLAGVRVTDGLTFVKTGRDGRYRIEVKFDAMTPYLPARTICISWPDGTFPIKDKKTGRLLWWRRLMDVRKTPDKVDFFLTKRLVKPPLVIAYGTDPHDALERRNNWVMPQEIAQGGNRVHVGMLLGDLMYAKLDTSDRIFAHVEKYARDFPVSFINVMGNHDTPQPLFGPHELAGHGGITKYLGPIRWSFDIAGVHVVSLNYWMMNEQALAWLEADLDTVPPGTPIYMFTHMWGPYLGSFCKDYPNLRFVMSGHSHRTLFAGRDNNTEFWTITSYYRLLYIDGWSWNFVDRRVAENPLYTFSAHKMGGGRTSAVSDVKLVSRRVALPGYATKGAPFGTSQQYDVAFSATPTGKKPATRFGLRISNERGYVFRFTYDVPSKTLNLAGRETYFSPDRVEAAMRRGNLPKPIREAMWTTIEHELVTTDQEKSPEAKKKYQAAKATFDAYQKADKQRAQAWLKKQALNKTVSFEINVCPGRIQAFVNKRVTCIEFYKIGRAVRIEYFAEGGEATFGSVKVMENGAGYIWKKFNRPVLNHLP
jgi:hypothetical protein